MTGADELHHELVRGMLVELDRPGDLLDLAAVHHRNRLGDLHRLLLVVRDDHGRRMRLVVQAPQPRAQLLAHLGVERAERLVEEQHLRVDRERPGKAHALPLAAGELRRVAVRERLELDELEQLADALPHLVLRPLADLQAERDVVPDRHVLEGRVVLEDEPDPAVLRRDTRDVLLGEKHLAAVRLLESGDDAQQGRFAASARTEQRDQRPGLDLERDVVEGGEVAEALGDVTDRDAHRYACSSRGRIKVMDTSTITAITASISEIAYAPDWSKLS